MGKIAKVFWVWLSLSLVIIYLVSAVQINDGLIIKERILNEQLNLYDNKKIIMKNQKNNLISLQENLLIQLALSQDIEQKNRIALQLKQLKEAERKRLAEEQRQMQEAKMDVSSKQMTQNIISTSRMTSAS